MRYRQQSLIDPQDLGYRRFCRDHKLLNQKIGTPAAIDPAVILAAEVELAVRHCLATQFGCLSPQRILSYEQRNALGYQRCYRELDAVIGDRYNPQFFVEIKSVTQRGRGMKAGYRQLQRSLTIARERWRSLQGILIEVSWSIDQASSEPIELSPWSILEMLENYQKSDQFILPIYWSGQQLAATMEKQNTPLNRDILDWAEVARFSQNFLDQELR